MKKTLHVKSRCQQRGIREELIDLVVQFGSKARSYDGANHLILSKKNCQFISKLIDQIIKDIQEIGVIEVGSFIHS